MRKSLRKFFLPFLFTAEQLPEYRNTLQITLLNRIFIYLLSNEW